MQSFNFVVTLFFSHQLAHRGAQLEVVLFRVVSQQMAYAVGQRSGGQRHTAVEVLAGGGIKTPRKLAKQSLVHTDRVGKGHDHNALVDMSGLFQCNQPFHQVLQGQQAGPFVGMQACLQIGLAWAITKFMDGQVALHTRCR